MKIGLLDIDGHNFPNLALMKISSYHKNNGDQVEKFFGLNHYDIVYASKVFTFTPDYDEVIMADKIVKGGTGFDLTSKLPQEIECQYPDYSLYGITDTAYGYLTRGCPRGCKFCIVAEKEGQKSVKVADLNQFWKGQKEIILLDPNILACKDWEDLLQQCIASKVYVDFTQGLDIRLMTEKKQKMLNQIRHKMFHFAWDNAEDMKTFEMLKEYRNGFNDRDDKLLVYVLTNFNSTFEQDLERVYKLREIGYDPYVMIYDKLNAPKQIRHLQRWCNSKFIFRTCKDFKDYKGEKWFGL